LSLLESLLVSTLVALYLLVIRLQFKRLAATVAQV
jgi:hypothetical protein